MHNISIALAIHMSASGEMRSASVYQSNTLRCVFAARLYHSGQTHRFRHYSSAAEGALEYPKKSSRNGNKEELYFYFTCNL